MAKAKKQKIKKTKKKGVLALAPFLSCLLLILAIMAVPSTIMLSVGLLPTLGALLLDRSKGKTKTISVGAMNLAICTFYLSDLWSSGNTVTMSLDIITDPVAIIMMYMGAVLGYFLHWVLGGFSSAMLYKKIQRRQRDIVKRQEQLKDRWGRKVTGSVPLSKDGFPILSEEE